MIAAVRALVSVVMLAGFYVVALVQVDQLRAVIAHELGHYSGLHTQLAGGAYRGRLTIAETIGGLSTYNPLRWVFGGYAHLYRLVDNVVSRRQELEADRASARVAGRAAAISALREVRGLSVEPGWTARFAPDDLFGGFGALLDARTDALATLREREPEVSGSAWDTHPPIGARVAAMADAPEIDRAPDTRKARAVAGPACRPESGSRTWASTRPRRRSWRSGRRAVPSSSPRWPTSRLTAWGTTCCC
ncbi:hypothetical protein Ais01nite_23530 [Asanoa ishikariensis]|uniref:M48 family metallopeptidase n=1 Tax=Asanoa ishikariensis TaxID=137265 RepID=UPI000ABE7698|nr:M48 family metalloprotease [Asanoa ishikariensis]GIF64318.1 hypothetical protein Ais01nite_23530 [Asanoa ishikariensis]